MVEVNGQSVQSLLEARRASLESARQQVQSFNPQIQRSQQMLRIAARNMPNVLTQQARLKGQEVERAKLKETELANIENLLAEQGKLESEFAQQQALVNREQAIRDAINAGLRNKNINRYGLERDDLKLVKKEIKRIEDAAERKVLRVQESSFEALRQGKSAKDLEKFGGLTEGRFRQLLSDAGERAIVKLESTAVQSIPIEQRRAILKDVETKLRSTPASKLFSGDADISISIPGQEASTGQNPYEVKTYQGNFQNLGSPIVNTIRNNVNTTRIINETKGFGTSGRTVSEFLTSPTFLGFNKTKISNVLTAIPTGIRLGSQAVGTGVEFGLNKAGFKNVTIPGYSFDVPQRRTISSMNNTEAFPRVTVKESVITSSGIGKATAIGGEVGTYLALGSLPFVGSTIFRSAAAGFLLRASDRSQTPETRISSAVEGGLFLLPDVARGATKLGLNPFQREVRINVLQESLQTKPSIDYGIVTGRGTRFLIDENELYKYPVRGIINLPGFARKTTVTQLPSRLGSFFGATGKVLDRPEALKALVKSGYTDKAAREVLREIGLTRRIGLVEATGSAAQSKGDILVNTKSSIYIRNKPGPDTFEGFKVRRPKEQVLEVNSNSKKIPIKGNINGKEASEVLDIYETVSKVETDFLTSKGKRFQKRTQAGKTTTELFTKSAALKLKEDIPLPIAQYRISNLEASANKEFDVYFDVARNKQTLPLVRSSKDSKGFLFISKDAPALDIAVTSPFKIISINKGVPKTGAPLSKLPKNLESIYGKSSDAITKLDSEIKKTIASQIPKAIPQAKIPPVFSDLRQIAKPSRSIYFGTGTYERTESVASPLRVITGGANVRSTITDLTLTRSDSQVKNRFLVDTRNTIGERLSTGLRIGLSPRFGERFAERNRDSLIQRNPDRIGERFGERIGERVAQRFNTALATSTTQSQRLGIRTPVTLAIRFPRPQAPERPPITPTIIKVPKLPRGGRNKVGIAREGKPVKFIAQVRRRGKFEAVTAPTTFREAVEIGRSKVLKTLGASLAIVEANTGQRVKVPKIFGFNPSKASPNVLVQGRLRRLSSAEERREIVASRRGNIFFR